MAKLIDVTDSELWQQLWKRLGHDGLVKAAKDIIEEDDAQRKIDDFFERMACGGLESHKETQRLLDDAVERQFEPCGDLQKWASDLANDVKDAND